MVGYDVGGLPCIDDQTKEANLGKESNMAKKPLPPALLASPSTPLSCTPRLIP